MFKPVEEHKQLADIEKEILKYWEEIKAFETSLEKSKGRPEFTFYDGPPFATGLPHYGHILAGTIKDVVTRYAHQTGHYVPRIFGWDTHGLPVEHEIDKKLQITDRKQIQDMGIDVYNEKCREIVMRYQEEWRSIIGRTGRWIDFDNAYKTMNLGFMESVWWVFKQLWDKGLVYQGVKVMPYSTGCKTPLSNFEANENYQQVNDPAVAIAFKVPGKDFELVAWTTTPWTLPSNLILAVNPKMTYCKVVDNNSKRRYVVMKDRLCELFKLKDTKSFTVESEFPGQEIVGTEYEPLFPYFASWKSRGAFKVYDADYVSNDSGTGIVHCAPGFGEEDYKVCLAKKIIEEGGEIVCPIDDNGCFTSEISDYKGVYVKEADKAIIKRLKDEGRLVKAGTIVHSYPFCWRSDTPLIYRAIPSWFVRVAANKEALIENTLKTNWVPSTIRDGRFIEWLKGARDWCISRNRYWGTPIPIWTDDEGKEFIAVGSVAELEQLSGRTGITDIHMHKIMDVTIKSPKTGKILNPEVFDCWFESGSMPFSQFHIPFSGKEWRQADFIAEGLDQTRGWFYTLVILSTFLGHEAPFKNLIVNGMVLAEDGKKMSKRLKNYPDPVEIMDKYGADALRLYLVNSPAVRADPLCFKGQGVQQVVRDVMLPWLNTLNFFVQQVLRHGGEFHRDEKLAMSSGNTLDKWILSRLNTLVKFIHTEMGKYHLYAVLPELVAFIDEMTNWYVRLNRDRLKSGEDAKTGLAVLFEVLFKLSLLMAPFTPFFAEYVYQQLKVALSAEDLEDSIHYLMVPQPNEAAISKEIERKVGFMQAAIRIARTVRDKKRIPVRRPMAELVVVCSQEIKTAIEELTNYITAELHVLKISFETDEKKYVRFQAQADGRVLGRKLGKQLRACNEALQKITYEVYAELYDKSIHNQNQGLPPPEFEVIPGVMVNTEEVKLIRSLVLPDEAKYSGGVDGEVVAFCDITTNPQILAIANAREIRNRVQQARKNLGLRPTDKVQIFIDTPEDSDIAKCVKSDDPEIKSALGLSLTIGAAPSGADLVGTVDAEVVVPFKITIIRA